MGLQIEQKEYPWSGWHFHLTERIRKLNKLHKAYFCCMWNFNTDIFKIIISVIFLKISYKRSIYVEFVFWSTTPFSLLEIKHRPNWDWRIVLQFPPVPELLSSRLLCLLSASNWLLTWCIDRPWKWSRHVPQTHPLTYNGLHGVISQKTGLFIPIVVRTSKPV
jgi:hypothetical protein